MTVDCLHSFHGVLNFVFYWQVHYSTCFDTKTVQSVCNLEYPLLYEGEKHWLGWTFHWEISSSSHAKLGNVTVNCSSTVESPCLREACKVPSALEIAVTPYSHLVGMSYRLSKNVSPSPDSMICPCVIGIMLCPDTL